MALPWLLNFTRQNEATDAPPCAHTLPTYDQDRSLVHDIGEAPKNPCMPKLQVGVTVAGLNLGRQPATCTPRRSSPPGRGICRSWRRSRTRWPKSRHTRR
ncbi:MAG: hypothetical protein KatS3mg114_0978 [Planctomycetaceae bacterium]|nr:MAG: hypothetical protein KatS3mg114_0978 [Planctomycetaceae bacterium]